MVTPKELGERLSELRHEKKLTQRRLAEQLHVTDKAVSRWERGIGYPDFQLLGELCQVLGVSVDELLYGSKETAPQKAPNLTASAEAPERAAPNASEKLPIQQSSLAALYTVFFYMGPHARPAQRERQSGGPSPFSFPGCGCYAAGNGSRSSRGEKEETRSTAEENPTASSDRVF